MEQDKSLPREPVTPASDARVPMTMGLSEQGPPETGAASDTELPTAVYASVVIAFGWVLFASGLMFGSGAT